MGAADFLMKKEMSYTVELLPHNEKLYNDIIQSIEYGHHSIFYSQGTGLGKSFIFMKLVNEYFPTARVLYIVPKNAIWKNMTHYKEFDYIVDRVTLATFTTFNTYPNKTISCADYDVVFVDECHHMLSDIQGKNVKQFLDDMVSWDKYVFGMTATPEINGVYVDEECFETSCYGLDIFEAIEQGLMPKMDIAIGIREEVEIPDNLREKYSIVGTQTLLDKVLSDYSHVTHWLAYFTTKEELEQNELELRKLFPEYKILKAYTGLDNVDAVISEFENSGQPVILMSVSMFLEGMHLDNVGGVLLYRNVQKSHTYAQILGRLCTIGQKYTPVIVDITGSVLSIKQFYTPKSSRASVSQRKVYSRWDVFDVTSTDYKLFDLMDELRLLTQKEYRGIHWTSYQSLDRALGRSEGTVSGWLYTNKDKPVQDYIDVCLKDYSYEEYVNNGFVGKYKKDGYEYVDYQDLADQLDIPYASIYYYMEIKGGSVDLNNLKYRKNTSEVFHITGLEKGESYRDIPIDSVNSVAKALGWSTSALHGWCKRYDTSDIKECIDHYLDKSNNIYRGVDISSNVTVANHYNKTASAVYAHIRKYSIDLKGYVDLMEDKQTKKYPEYRGVCLHSVLLTAKQLGISDYKIYKIKSDTGYQKLEDIIDYMYEVAETHGKSQDVYAREIMLNRKKLGLFSDEDYVGDE